MQSKTAWVQAIPSEQLGSQAVVFKHAGRQIALFRTAGEIFAVDNRCPHEGYPLAQGTVDGQCQLTCNWHNWKFRLRDGECVLGGDDVRAYPVKEENSFIWLDLTDPPPEIAARKILKGLHTAFRERDFGRICREVSRLKFSGSDPLLAVGKAVQWSFSRLEFGTTHAYAAAADWLALAQNYESDWERKLICLAEPIDHIAFDVLRREEFPYAAAAGAYDPDQLLAAIESEDTGGAEGLVGAAFAEGHHWKDLEPLFARAALAHYNDFGHALIYVTKLRQLLEFLPNAERELSLSLARSLCYSTREDLIPEFAGYAPALAQLQAALADEPSANAVQQAAPYPASIKTALKYVVDTLPGGKVESVYDSLLTALARNMLHYDTSYGSAWDRPVSQNVGWLDFTHGITFANAVRVCCASYPELWPQGLLQMACFLGRNQSYLDQGIDEEPWFVADEASFFAETEEKILDHGLRDPIFSAHLVKTALAVREELAFASENASRYLLAALNRFLHSPLKQKHIRRLARQAIDLVQRDYG